jgi:peptidoglycan/LPS O-acetylase OafA/YrhL
MMKRIGDYFFGDFRLKTTDYPALYGLRAMALFMLYFVHGYFFIRQNMVPHSEYLRNIIINNSACIDLFFVLSGFLIAGPLFRELNTKKDIDFKKFYVRRTLRIFPAYYLFVFFQHFILAPKLMQGDLPEAGRKLADAYQYQYIFDFLYLANYFPDTFMVHIWSLSLEEQFYIFLPPFLLYAYFKIAEQHRLRLLIGACIVPLILRVISYYWLVLPAENPKEAYDRFIYWPFFTHADSLLVGVTAAHIFVNRPEWIERLNTNLTLWRSLLAIILASTFAFGILTHEYDPSIPTMVLRFPLFSISYALLMVMSFRKESILHRFLSLRVFIPFARISYSTYISHHLIMFPVTVALVRAWGPEITVSEYLKGVAIGGLFCSIFGYFYYLIAERPLLFVRQILDERRKRAMALQGSSGA